MKRIATSGLLAFAMACGGATEVPATEGTVQTARDASPEGVAKLADAIKQSPASAEKTLSAAGWTAADFEKALWDIAKDPKKSKAYAAARTK